MDLKLYVLKESIMKDLRTLPVVSGDTLVGATHAGQLAQPVYDPKARKLIARYKGAKLRRIKESCLDAR